MKKGKKYHRAILTLNPEDFKKSVGECRSIYRKAGQYFKMNLGDKSRKDEFVRARYMTFYYLGMNAFHQSVISQVVGKDRTTVLYGIQQMKDWTDVDPDVFMEYSKLKKELDEHRGFMRLTSKN